MQTAEQALKESFLDYSAFVLQRRALSDVRDCLRYTARQILHAQYREGLVSTKPFKKSQKSVSAATAFSYVHGGSSAYGQIIRMGRPLVQRYFLESLVGNGGTPIASDDYAAERYTECRLSPLADRLFETINKNTLSPNDFSPTYDEEGVFPLVLPSLGFYNLVNGAHGAIGVGLISSIPQFNLREVNAVISALIRDPEASIELYPDFASGGTLLNPRTTLSSLGRGEGKSVLIRGTCNHGKDTNGQYVNVVELPFGVYTETVCKELEKAIDQGSSPVNSFKDLTKTTVNMRIYGTNLAEVEEWLYKNTSVQRHFTIKMIMLDGGKTPKLFNIRTALLSHIEHAKQAYRKSLEWDLNALKIREEILKGLIRAQSIIDSIIAMIKASDGRQKAIYALTTEEWGFTTLQAEAIADLRLHRLSTMDVAKLSTELDANLLDQEDLVDLLANAQRFNEKLIGFYEEVAKKFGDNRRTKIYAGKEFETAQDGTKMDKNFFLRYSPVGYAVSDNEEVFEGENRPIFIQPDDEVIILTTEGRGFSRKATEFESGECQEWCDLVKLNLNEQIKLVLPANIVDTKEEFTFILDTGAKRPMHKSTILLGASKRGKKLIPGKVKVSEIVVTPE